MRKVLVLSALALLAGCDQPKPRGETASPPPAAAPAPAAAPIAAPAWAAALADQDFAAAFPAKLDCKGYVDGPVERYPNGAMVVGWSWNPQAGAGFEHVVLADAAGKLAGFGDGGVARPDVPAADKAVTRPDVGWTARIGRTSGTYAVYGVDLAGKAACKLGEARL